MCQKLTYFPATVVPVRSDTTTVVRRLTEERLCADLPRWAWS